MKKLLLTLLIVLFPLSASAQLTTFQGGTGSTSPSGILYGDSTIRLKTVGIGSGLQFSGGTLSATGVAGDWATTSEAYYWSQFRDWKIDTDGFLTPTTTIGVLMGNATTTNATTTNLSISGTLDVDGLTSALTLTGATGVFAEYAGTSCTNQFVRSLSALGVATCASVANTDLENSTVSYGGVTLSLGGTDATPAFNLVDATGLPIVAGTTGTLTVARGGTGVTTFGGDNRVLFTSAVDTLASEAAFTYTGLTNLLTVENIIAVGSSTIDNLSVRNGTTTNATSTNVSISTTLDVDTLTSALVLTGATGIFAEYAGTSCTNQFVRSLSALGAATCATVANTDLANSSVSYGGVSVSLGGSDATPAFDLTDATSLPISTGVSGLGANVATFLATPSTANLLAAVTGETGSGAVVFGTGPTIDGATLTGVIDGGGATSIEIVNGTGPTVDASGEIAIDTTSGQFKWFGKDSVHIVTGTTTKSFNLASSTIDAMGNKFSTATTSILLMNNPEPFTLKSFYCTASTTGSAIVRFGDNSNWTESLAFSSGSRVNVSTNNTWTADEPFVIQASSTAGTVNRITCSATMIITAD